MKFHAMRTSFTLAASISLAVPALAFDQSAISGTGGFVASISGETIGSSIAPGADLNTILYGYPSNPQYPHFAWSIDSEQFSGFNSATATTNYSFTGYGSTSSGSSSGTASLGTITMSASNNAQNGLAFPMSAVNGGWKDSFTANAQGMTGMQGYAVVAVNVSASMEAHGFAGAAKVALTAYKNNVQLTKAVSGGHFIDGSQSDLIVTDNQLAVWSVASYGYGENDASRYVSDQVLFAIPVTFGQSFSFGVYDVTFAGMRSASSVPGNSTSQVNDTVTWGGVFGFFDNDGNKISGASLTSNLAAVPEPETYAMFLAGLGLIGAIARRKRFAA